jgi:hypothetical protein
MNNIKEPKSAVPPFMRIGPNVFVVSNWPVAKKEQAQLRPLEESERELFDTIVASAEIEAFAWIAAKDGENEDKAAEKKRARAAR